MIDPKALRFAVARAGVPTPTDFSDSLRYWHTEAPDPSDEWLRSFQRVTTPLTIASADKVLEFADCLADVSVPQGSAIHVYGDLDARISFSSHCEVIVAGDVLPGGSIQGDGIVNIYVAGNLHGDIVNESSTRVWVGGDLHGRVSTGTPSTHVRVLGDYLGTIAPLGEPALLFLEVCGFTPFANLQLTSAVRYTVFNALLHRSDCAAGFYPDPLVQKQVARHPSHNQWVVLAQSNAGGPE